MTKRGHVGLSAATRVELWTRRTAGESLLAIALALGKTQSTIYTAVQAQGGIRPPVRRRAARVFTAGGRETISRGLAASASMRALARALGRAPSSISREITRNGGRHRYRALDADSRAWRQAKRPKPCKLATAAALCAVVEEKRKRNWSPEQIALPAGLMASLTWDRGGEMAQHHRFAVATEVAVYFCDPRSPWQRGTNENTNGLLRQYFPDGTDLSGYTQRDLDRVAQELNTRPRKTLGFRTPAAALAESVAPIR